MPVKENYRIGVVIPCFKVKKHILELLEKIPDYVSRIYVVDDKCPEETGVLVSKRSEDERVTVLFNDANIGVGGAVMAGMKKAIEDKMDVIVKVDGDGQMDPSLIKNFVIPILDGDADYTKGNRFYSLESVSEMPGMRIFGNGVLSLMAKFSTGYWDVFDPTNGYTAIHSKVAALLPLKKISNRYFFETDMLFRLGTIRAVVQDIPMVAIYQDESSNLKISKILGEFLFKHVKNMFKRIFYNYFLRDVNAGSLELLAGVAFTGFGVCYGGYHWIEAYREGQPSAGGVIMLSALTVILGVQMLLGFLGIDMGSTPKKPICRQAANIRDEVENA
ncbi:glycosyl transferase family 2 [Rhodanobacter sp. Root627]|nr:glycosyl transferase family 2 [Rhodanobacter sp. Root627]